jgi:hypothetical protein
MYLESFLEWFVLIVLFFWTLTGFLIFRLEIKKGNRGKLPRLRFDRGFGILIRCLFMGPLSEKRVIAKLKK